MRERNTVWRENSLRKKVWRDKRARKKGEEELKEICTVMYQTKKSGNRNENLSRAKSKS